MGWKETCTVEERMRFMVAVEKGEESFAAICRRFNVSRRIGYKWRSRFEEEGAAGLFDHSRAPLHHPQAIGEEIAERCLEVRWAHPTWGPVKVLAYLERYAPKIDWPAASTIGELFDREGLTVKRRLRRRSPPSSAPFAAIFCAARPCPARILIMSGRCWRLLSASSGCPTTCGRTTDLPLPRAALADCRDYR